MGRMSAQAAAKLGIRTVIYNPEEGSPASQVADETVIGAYEDQNKLKEFSEKVDVVSYEFENIPVETVEYLKTLKPVYPDSNLLEIAQDRLKEKSYLNDISIPTARYAEVISEEQLNQTLKDWGVNEAIIKTTRFGYDGKGQWRYPSSADFQTIRNASDINLIVEEIVDFLCEVSVIIARDQFGKTVSYGPVQNSHKNHILDVSTFPSDLNENLSKSACDLAITLADQIGLIGVLALEMFVTQDGRILANEIAPRTHNSGHWTIDACDASQFENHVRAVCGLPVEDPNARPAQMINLIGDDIHDLSAYKSDENACIHLYGKTESRPGRKMGHVTVLK